MISPELLRRFPFFGKFNDEQLKEIAMIAEMVSVNKDVVLFEECGPADIFYLLLEGGVELYYKAEEQYKSNKELSVGDINPGEVLAISAMIEPYVLNASARTAQPSSFIKINAVALRELLEKEPRMGFIFMRQLNKALMERLTYTRVQLAAAWA
jgi:CRP-like cAMP-binding protein